MEKNEEIIELKRKLKLLSSKAEEIRKIIREKEKTVSGKIVVDKDKCVLCGICSNVCPVNAITVNDEVKIDESLCVLCGRCAQECPREAIYVNFKYEGGKYKMPRFDGTGPRGQGPGTGRGLGRGGGRGRMGGSGMGSGGYCVCPACGKRVTHNRGVPCYSIKCPDCGANMTREM